MNIKAKVKRVCKNTGVSVDDVEITNDDIVSILIRKCESSYYDNEGCTFSIESNISIDTSGE